MLFSKKYYTSLHKYFRLVLVRPCFYYIANFMQLVSENVKATQLHSALLSEKQALAG